MRHIPLIGLLLWALLLTGITGIALFAAVNGETTVVMQMSLLISLTTWAAILSGAGKRR